MLDFQQSLINSTLRKLLKRLHYPLEVMLICVRWYVAYPLSLRHIEEMIAKSAEFLWITSRFTAGQSKMLAVLATVFRRRKRAVSRPRNSFGPDSTIATKSYFLANCPGLKVDGGRSNGIPCEQQWCAR